MHPQPQQGSDIRGDQLESRGVEHNDARKVGVEIVLRPPERLPLTGIALGGYLTRVPFKSALPVALRCRAQGIGVAAMS